MIFHNNFFFELRISKLRFLSKQHEIDFLKFYFLLEIFSLADLVGWFAIKPDRFLKPVGFCVVWFLVHKKDSFLQLIY